MAWAEVIARMVGDQRGGQSRLATIAGVEPATVHRWLTGSVPEPDSVRRVAANSPEHSLPWFIAMAYDIPLIEMADGAAIDLMPLDRRISAQHRDALSGLYLACLDVAERHERSD